MQAKLNGRDYFLLVDTGTSITIIDKPVAEALRLPRGERMNLLGVSGQIESTITRLQSLELDRVRSKTRKSRSPIWG